MSGEMKAKKEDVSSHRPIMFLGQDLMEIKCFRDSFICGICTGAVGGLATFLWTSKTLFSTHVAFASIWLGVLGYWFPCRYKWESRVMLIESFKEKYGAPSPEKKSTDAS